MVTELTKSQAQELCDSIEISLDYYVPGDEEYDLMIDNNPTLHCAYLALLDIAYKD